MKPLKHILDIAAVAAIAVGLWYGMEALRERLRDPADWFSVIEVRVPDHAVGEDPIIPYDREPHRPFWADWQVRVLRIAENGESEGSVCTGHGRSAYEPGLKIAEMRLSEYAGIRCRLAPGRYALRTECALDNGVTVRNASGVFQAE